MRLPFFAYRSRGGTRAAPVLKPKQALSAHAAEPMLAAGVAESIHECSADEADIGSLTLKPGTTENGVVVGADQFLFLAGGAHNVLEIVSGTKTVNERSLRNFCDNIERRSEWAARRGVPYLHLIFPDKQSIVPELWPFERCLRLGDLYLEHCTDRDLPILYPVALLRNLRETALSKVDTHVTPVGSIHVAADIVQRLTGTRDEGLVSDMLAAQGRERRFGDLGSKLRRPVSAMEAIFSAPIPGRFLSNGLGGGNNGLIDLRFNPDAVHDRRCVLFGDSFGRDICLYLQFWFSEVFFFRTGFFHEDLAARCAPDFLVTENVERYLDDCISDRDAPDFAAYLDREGIASTPSVGFAETLAAILPPSPKTPDLEDAPAARPVTKGLASVPVATRPAPVGDEAVIEAPRLVPRTMPVFVIDQSARMPELRLPEVQDIHGSLHAERRDVLLFGPSIHVSGDTWWCESRHFGEQFVDFVASEGYQTQFPGPKPRITSIDGNRTIDFTPVVDEIEEIGEPLFLATPLEPHNWGRWISTVVCKIEHYRRLGEGRRLFCVASLPWQRDLLARLGIADGRVREHDPGRTYYCRDLAGIEYNVTNMTVSTMERERFQQLRHESSTRLRESEGRAGFGEKIFISRRGTSRRNPNYRVLQNEEALAEALERTGYKVIEPERLSFDQQVAAFGNARSIVCLGGAAIYNAVFCDPNAAFVSIESSDVFLGPHTSLLSSLDLRYGIIVGSQDHDDETLIHKRWSVDVARCVETVEKFAA